MEQYLIEFINKKGDTVYEEYFSCDNQDEVMAQADHIGANLAFNFIEIVIRNVKEI